VARILLDTADLGHTADTLLGIDAELGGVLARLPGDAAIVMPPAVAAEVSGAVMDAVANVGHVTQRFAATAVDLRRRVLFAEMEETRASGFTSGALMIARLLRGRGDGSWPRLLRHAGGPIGEFVPQGLTRLLEAKPSWVVALVHQVADDIHDPIGTFNDIIRFSKRPDLLEIAKNAKDRAAYRFIAPLIESPYFRLGSGALAVWGAFDNAQNAWESSDREPTLARGFTVIASGLTDAAFSLDNPVGAVLSGANFMSGGAVRADAAVIEGMLIDGVVEGDRGLRDAQSGFAGELESGDYFNYARHLAGGAVSGFAHGANDQLNVWARQVDDGKWGAPLQAISKVENYAIDKTYEPISHVVSGMSNAAGAGVHAGAEAAKSSGRAVSNGVQKLVGLL
jgi:hypothetical protein